MQDCKQQILNTIANNNCCSHAFLNVVVSASQISKDFTNLIINGNENVLEKVTKILLNFYPNLEINSWDSFLLIKGNIYDILIDINYKNQLDHILPCGSAY